MSTRVIPWSHRGHSRTLALKELVQQFTDITGVQVELELVGDEEQVASLPKPLGDCLYRVAQECLNNVRKHAQASFVHLELDATDAAEVRLTISGDGVGLPDREPGDPAGFGMQSMVERVSALNGTLALRRGRDQDPNRGTTGIATVPAAPG